MRIIRLSRLRMMMFICPPEVLLSQSTYKTGLSDFDLQLRQFVFDISLSESMGITRIGLTTTLQRSEFQTVVAVSHVLADGQEAAVSSAISCKSRGEWETLCWALWNNYRPNTSLAT